MEHHGYRALLSDDGGQVAAGRVAADGDAVGVDAQLGGIFVGPSQRAQRIFGGGRERVLRCEAVVDGEHRVPRLHCE